MSKSKPKRIKPGPMRLMREFANGKWILILAREHELSETYVESALMDAAAKLLGKSGAKTGKAKKATASA